MNLHRFQCWRWRQNKHTWPGRSGQVCAAGLKCILGATFECKKHTGSQFTDLRTGLKLTDRLFKKVTCRDTAAEAKPTADKSMASPFFPPNRVGGKRLTHFVLMRCPTELNLFPYNLKYLVMMCLYLSQKKKSLARRTYLVALSEAKRTFSRCVCLRACVHIC